jgi:hypothetical protein
VSTSIELARAAARALHMPESTLRLHMKTLAAADAISFKGYGPSAAQMTSLDAARLLIAVAASYFAKDSAVVLDLFAGLRPLGSKGGKATLEVFLAEMIDGYRTRGLYLQPVNLGLSNLAAEATLKVMWVGGDLHTKMPRVAVVRWFRPDGRQDSATFASREMAVPFIDEARLARIYADVGIVHARTITARALRDVADSLSRPTL